MICVPFIRKTGSSPNGDHLMAKFEDVIKPDFVQIKGTTDKQPLKGASGQWISGEKYMNTGVTLQLFKDGVILKECCYSPLTGERVACEVPQPSVNLFKATPRADGTTVDVTWTSVSEEDLAVYLLEKNGEIFDTKEPQGNGTDYTIVDIPGTGTYRYTLKGLRLSNSELPVLGEDSTTL